MSTAFITILLTDSYIPGVLVLASQLSAFHPDIPRVVLISDDISLGSKSLLDSYFDEIVIIEELIESQNIKNLLLFGRPDLNFTLSKINIFNITKFDKLIYFDADILPLKPLPSSILELELALSQVAASPDASWPDIFNSGFLILKPSSEKYAQLSANLRDSFDGADQGLLNQSFKEWIRLPFLYNVTVNYAVSTYEYLPLLNHFKNDIVNVHFIGLRKPWKDRDVSNDSTGFYQQWWNIFNKNFTDIAGEIFNISDPLIVTPSIKKQETKQAFSGGPEGHKLNDTKLSNKWDSTEVEESATTVQEGSSYPPAIFPWEEHRAKPTRVFGPDPEYLHYGVIDKLHDLDLEDKS